MPQLRPKTFKDFIGQKNAIRQLSILTSASNKSTETMGHVLLEGPPGLGKTTLAQSIAHTLSKPIRISSGPALEKPHHIVGLLSNIEPQTVVFIDEIHRIPKNLEEYLYSVMEDFALDIIIDSENGSKTIRVNTPPFTLIGATTLPGMLSMPLLTRFPNTIRLKIYNFKEMQTICKRNFELLKLKYEDSAVELISENTRGTPRVLNNIINFVKSYLISECLDVIDINVVQNCLDLMEIGPNGLTNKDIKYLETIKTIYKGGPVGIKAISSTNGIDESTILTIIEPFLLSKGYVKRTGRGREITDKAKLTLSKICPSS